MSEFSRETLLNIIETDHVQCGEASALARMALAAMDSEPVAIIDQANLDYLRSGADADVWPPEREEMGDVLLYRHPQTAPVVPENCVTAEHRRVIEMLLNVCGAAFELADDSCQQDVDGEDCHVVPDDAFQKLSDALDEIENTLPTEDIDRPDVFLAWSAMPRAALKSLLQVPVVMDDTKLRELFDSWFASDCSFDLSPEASEADNIAWRESYWYVWQRCRAAMLAAAPQSPGSEPATVPGKWIPVSERMPEDSGRYWCYVEEQNSLGKSHYQWNCSWNGDVWSDKALTGRVTHWMPLPAAPQEVR